MKYTVIIEKGENSYGAYVTDLPGCAVVAETEDEAMELLKEAIEIHIKELQKDGIALHQNQVKVRELELL